MPYTSKAYTLIELLITLSIISILLGYALPAFSNLLDKSNVDANSQRLVQVLQLARTTAITNNRKVTLCPTETGNNCSSDWSKGYVAFTDLNGDREINEQDEILFQFISIDQKTSLSWKAFGHKKSLQWLQTGITNHQNGSFELCYDNKEKLARGLFITKAGRIRFSKDTNGDELHENSIGGSIKC